MLEEGAIDLALTSLNSLLPKLAASMSVPKAKGSKEEQEQSGLLEELFDHLKTLERYGMDKATAHFFDVILARWSMREKNVLCWAIFIISARVKNVGTGPHAKLLGELLDDFSASAFRWKSGMLDVNRAALIAGITQYREETIAQIKASKMTDAEKESAIKSIDLVDVTVFAEKMAHQANAKDHESEPTKPASEEVAKPKVHRPRLTIKKAREIVSTTKSHYLDLYQEIQEEDKAKGGK